jgi:hypothetical protein
MASNRIIRVSYRYRGVWIDFWPPAREWQCLAGSFATLKKARQALDRMAARLTKGSAGDPLPDSLTFRHN